MKSNIYIKNHEIIADFLSVVFISGLILSSVKNEFLMTIGVLFIIFLRTMMYPLIVKESIRNNFIFFIICTLLGSFNDWRSVDVKKIYEYHAPTSFSDFSTIPLWMYLFWGIILGLMSRLGRWNWGRGYQISDDIIPWIKKSSSSVFLKILLQLMIILLTRQAIYKYYLDPILSWAPYVVAIVSYLFLFKVNRDDLYFFLTAVVLGTIVESLYINLADLHYYHLGLIFGVPIWITLWWGLSVLIWRDLSARLCLNLSHTL